MPSSGDKRLKLLAIWYSGVFLYRFFLLSSLSETSVADPLVWQVGDPSLAVERDVYMYRSYIALRYRTTEEPVD